LKRFRWLLWPCLLLWTYLLPACEAPAPVTGAVGLFYGGQVQELETLVLDPVRAPTFGFKIELPTSLSGQEHEVRWEVVRPGPAGRRVTQVGTLRVASGRSGIEQVLPVDLRESLGILNVRVLVDGQVVIDRAIDVRKP